MHWRSLGHQSFDALNPEVPLNVLSRVGLRGLTELVTPIFIETSKSLYCALEGQVVARRAVGRLCITFGFAQLPV
ncbi:MAG: hypothetical protein KF775_16065 [Cyclobacteriaceae bacterium]|nr:hypothetical protein [Cyclobacteriaceae bacterium]